MPLREVEREVLPREELRWLEQSRTFLYADYPGPLPSSLSKGWSQKVICQSTCSLDTAESQVLPSSKYKFPIRFCLVHDHVWLEPESVLPDKVCRKCSSAGVALQREESFCCSQVFKTITALYLCVAQTHGYHHCIVMETKNGMRLKE